MRTRFGCRHMLLACTGLILCALTSAGAQAACYAPDQQLSQVAIDGFIGNPSQLLQQNPQGGAQLISSIRDLVASNPATLPAILALLSGANAGQQTAIGTGLGQAALICVRSDPTFATEIQQQVATSNIPGVILAFAAATGNQPTGTATGAAGGGGGGVGGQTVGFGSLGGVGGGGFQSFTANSVLNSSTNYFTGGTSSAGSPARSVSP